MDYNAVKNGVVGVPSNIDSLVSAVEQIKYNVSSDWSSVIVDISKI